MLAEYRLSACLILAALLACNCNAQLLDTLLNSRPTSPKQLEEPIGTQTANVGSELGSMLRRLMSSMQSVNVPAFYEMNKNGSSMGINVLSGLVRVERGQHAERNGLVGPRPLSVRVFGVPVFERGERIRAPGGATEPLLPAGRETNDRPETGADEELPIES